MPKILKARPPHDDGEDRKIRKLAGARHAPADWIERARIIALSWDGLGVWAIAGQLGCHPKKVRRWLHRFNAEGIDGLGDRPGAGRRRRITEAQRSAIIVLARSEPPGRLARDGAGELPAENEDGPPNGRWTPSPRLPGTPGSPWAAARCGGSCWRRRCAGGGPAAGRPAPTRSAPQRTAVVELYTAPPEGSTVICADELGAGDPAHLPARAGVVTRRAPDQAPLEYSRGPDKTWACGGLRVAGGQEVTMCAPSRNSAHYQRFLQHLETANSRGQIIIITDNLSRHDSKSTRAWLENHPRIRHAFIPTGACWLNLREGWWRIFRRQALAGQDFADPDEIACATRVATAQLNARARPWVWGRPQPKHRSYRRRFVYIL